MENIVSKSTLKLSEMWIRILNLESTLFPALKEELRLEELSLKEQKLIKKSYDLRNYLLKNKSLLRF